LQISVSVARFFENYSEYADRAFLSVKGGCLPGKLDVDGSSASPLRSVEYAVDNILKALGGKKRLDLFQPASHDPNYEIEHYVEVLNELLKEGKFDYIGRSGVAAETVRRAPTVRNPFPPPDPSAYCTNQVMPIASVEIEVSPQSYEQRTKDGEHRPYFSCLSAPRKLIDDSIFMGLVIPTCKELGIAVVAYS
jgi:pyridoxine 4-dehydrogenase